MSERCQSDVRAMSERCQSTMRACASEVTKRLKYSLEEIFLRAPSCVWKKAIYFCPSGLSLLRFRKIWSAFRGSDVAFQKFAWFYASDGSHCKVHVHFEEFVSHSRFQTLAAELQNGISEIFPGEV